MNKRKTIFLAIGLGASLAAGALANDAGSRSRSKPTQVRMAAEMNAEQHNLYNAMRRLWEDHTTWTRLFIVSAANDLSNKEATTSRLLQNQIDIGNAIKPFYGDSAGDKLSALLKDHILIAAEIIKAAKRSDSDRVSDQKRDWYENADQIADFLSEANSRNWPRDEMRGMMRDHLDLTLEEAVAEIRGDFGNSVRKYDQVRIQILKMADMLSEGIVTQFPGRFSANAYAIKPVVAGYAEMRMESGTVIPFRLNERLSSNDSSVGDRFTANIDTNDYSNYQGMPTGAVLEGHVDSVRAKSGDTPGVLGLAFDRMRMPNGQTYRIYGSLIGLDSNSVENDNGRLVAKSGAKSADLKYVGYGAGAGALVSILTKGNILTNTLIGGALGFLFGEIQKDPSKARNVTLDSGSKFGVRLTRDLTFRNSVPDYALRVKF